MVLRQKLQVMILLLLILFTFASYHAGTGGTGWLQWLAVVTIAAFVFVFDLAFTNDSQFIFDPDAENWRRKTVSTGDMNLEIGCCIFLHILRGLTRSPLLTLCFGSQEAALGR